MTRTAEHNAKIAAGLRSRGVGEKPKRCPKCQEIKPRDQFRRRANGHSASACMLCAGKVGWQQATRTPEAREKARQANRRAQFKRRYGITIEEYDELLDQQDGVCAICQEEPTGARPLLFVDHDHGDGRIRGLLCGPCNTLIGMARDRVEVLQAATAYLARGGRR